ncbi:MAG: O-methyltransferase [Nitrosopumilaceae archaeon]|nr:O-methyltransferase [Nitrosopumilaceae archaeon]
MNANIRRALERLNAASKLENSRAVRVPAGELMSAITWETGEFFNIMLRAMGARSALEIGMSTGFSTIWLAEAVMETGGRVTTIEMDDKKIRRASDNFEDAGVRDIIDIAQGRALDVLEDLRGSSPVYDFVLIDADKENVPRYFDMVLPMVRKGGIIATDNMLYPERFSDMMGEFGRLVRQNASVRTVTLPIGNGEEITVKL